MSIAETVLDCNKLRQERHEEARGQHRRDHALNLQHAAPDGARAVSRVSSSINMALLTELSRSRIPLKTAKIWPLRSPVVDREGPITEARAAARRELTVLLSSRQHKLPSTM